MRLSRRDFLTGLMALPAVVLLPEVGRILTDISGSILNNTGFLNVWSLSDAEGSNLLEDWKINSSGPTESRTSQIDIPETVTVR